MIALSFKRTRLVSIINYILINNIIVSHQGNTGNMMRAAQFKPGGPENLHIAEVSRPSLRENEILLKVIATAINRADTLQRRGMYPAPAGESDILGLEAAGVVHSLGPGCQQHKVGDRVMALLAGGGNAEYVAVPEKQVLTLTPEMTFTQAAAIPEVWLTAYQLLHFVGKMSAGDNVLIHAGGSGVGTAAVQLVTLAGGKAYVTAGSQEKINMAKTLGAVDGFNYKQGNFSKAVLNATGGKGVDLILDCVGSNFWEQNVESVATDGTWVLYGLLSGGNVNGPLLAKMLRKRVKLIPSTLRARPLQYKAELVEEFTKEALPHFQDGRLKTIIHKVFPSLDDIGAAHRMMEENTNTGKIVITVNNEGEKKLEL